MTAQHIFTTVRPSARLIDCIGGPCGNLGCTHFNQRCPISAFCPIEAIHLSIWTAHLCSCYLWPLSIRTFSMLLHHKFLFRIHTRQNLSLSHVSSWAFAQPMEDLRPHIRTLHKRTFLPLLLRVKTCQMSARGALLICKQASQRFSIELVKLTAWLSQHHLRKSRNLGAPWINGVRGN